jgi:hypothetical protein
MTPIQKEIVKLCESEEGKAISLTFLPTISDNIKDLDKTIRSRLFIILGACFLFELTSRAQITGISIGGFHIKEYSGIEKLLPLIISYLFFMSWLNLSTGILLKSLHDAILGSVYPNLYTQDLSKYLQPPHMVGIYTMIGRQTSGVMKFFIDLSIVPTALILMFAVPAFLVYTYTKLIERYGVSDPLTLFSLLLSIFFLLQSLLVNSAVSNLFEDPPAPATS